MNRILKITLLIVLTSAFNTLKSQSIIGSISELQMYSGNDYVHVKGYYTEGDGGGGHFILKNTSSVVNDGTVFNSSSSNNNEKWIRVYDGGINVKWFGATPNDTISDHISIQKAINSLKESGGSLYFPKGTYRVQDSIKLFSNIKFYGEGSASIIELSNSGAITITGNLDNSGVDQDQSASDILIQNIHFQGNAQEDIIAIKSTKTWNLRIKDCHFSKLYSAWEFDQSIRDKFNNNKLYDVSIGVNQKTNSRSADLSLTGNMIYSNLEGFLSLLRIDGLNFTDNLIFGATNSDAGFAIKIDPNCNSGECVTSNWIRIINNTFFIVGGSIPQTDSLNNFGTIYINSHISQTIIKSNIFGHTKQPIRIIGKNSDVDRSGRISISDNLFEQNHDYGGRGNTIFIKNCDQIDVTNNRLNKVGGYANSIDHPDDFPSRYSGIVIEESNIISIDQNEIIARSDYPMKSGISLKSSSKVKLGDGNYIQNYQNEPIEEISPIDFTARGGVNKFKIFRIELKRLDNEVRIYSKELGFNGNIVTENNNFLGHYKLELPFKVFDVKLIASNSSNVNRNSGTKGVYGLRNRFSALQNPNINKDSLSENTIYVDIVNQNGDSLSLTPHTSFNLTFSAYIKANQF